MKKREVTASELRKCLGLPEGTEFELKLYDGLTAVVHKLDVTIPDYPKPVGYILLILDGRTYILPLKAYEHSNSLGVNTFSAELFTDSPLPSQSVRLNQLNGVKLFSPEGFLELIPVSSVLNFLADERFIEFNYLRR